jgi:hypothetical protein
MSNRETGVLRDTWSAMIAVIKATYAMAPVLVVFLGIVVFGVVALALTSAKLMIGFVLLIVLLVTIIVFASTSNFGEATLALVAGVLTAYSVNWTSGKFIAFVTIWFGFLAIAIVISSIKIAARSEAIYRDAAIAYSSSDADVPEVEKRLQAIAKDRTQDGLGPIERAEVLRLFSFRKLPVEAMPDALRATIVLSVITQIDHMHVAVFVADAFKVFEPRRPGIGTDLADILYRSIKGSAVPPADYIRGFECARHLILSGSVEPLVFLDRLQAALEAGVPPEIVAGAIEGSGPVAV